MGPLDGLFQVYFFQQFKRRKMGGHCELITKPTTTLQRTETEQLLFWHFVCLTVLVHLTKPSFALPTCSSQCGFLFGINEVSIYLSGSTALIQLTTRRHFCLHANFFDGFLAKFTLSCVNMLISWGKTAEENMSSLS